MFLEKNAINLFQDVSCSDVKSKRPCSVVALLTLKGEWPLEGIKEEKLLITEKTLAGPQTRPPGAPCEV